MDDCHQGFGATRGHACGHGAVSLAAAIAACLSAGAAIGQPASENVLEEVFVTGSRISRSGFDTPTPVTAIDNEYMRDLGFVNVGAAVQQLPINKASLTPETNGFGSWNVGAQIANLRALGSNRTLTLVDGRRHIPSTDTGNVDLNLVPPLLVERTEVVTGGASAAYGSDALAGVVNVILDKDLEGLRFQADRYQTSEGDGESTHVSAAGGMQLFGGRGHFIVGGEWEDSEGVDSCIRTRDWCRDRPGLISNAQSALNGEPRNIITNQVGRGDMTSGGLITAADHPNPGVPPRLPPDHPLYGIQFDADGNPIPFQHGEYYGNSNEKGGEGFSLFQTTNPRTPVERYSVFTRLSYDITDRTNFFAEASFGSVDGYNLGAARWFNGQFSIQIDRDNPFIPKRLRTSWTPAASARSASASTGRTGAASRATRTTTSTVWCSGPKARSTTTGLGTRTTSTVTTAGTSSCCASPSRPTTTGHST